MTKYRVVYHISLYKVDLKDKKTFSKYTSQCTYDSMTEAWLYVLDLKRKYDLARDIWFTVEPA